MSHGRVHRSCSSREAKPDRLLARIVSVRPHAQGHAAAELRDVVRGEKRRVLGTAGQTPVPPVLLETDASTATRQSGPQSPGAGT